jgi:4-carboxymuconolactone decarboxylase
MRVIVWIVVAMSFVATAGAQTSGGASSATPGALSKSDVLPKDIDPESLSRLPLLKRADLDEDGKRLYDELAGGPDKTVTPTGPVALSLYSTKVGEAMQMMNQHLRYHGALKPRDYEVAILVVAREFDQAYEWSGHEMGAHNAKVPEPVIDAIRYNKDTVGLSDRDTLIIAFTRALFQHQHQVDSDLYAKTVATFGKQGTFELASIIGDYALTAVLLNATDQHLPPGRVQSLPAK